jgi:hypothetical protein
MPLLRNLLGGMSGGQSQYSNQYSNQHHNQYSNQYANQSPQDPYSQQPYYPQGPAAPGQGFYSGPQTRPADFCGAGRGLPCACSQCQMASSDYNMPMTRREHRRYQKAERHTLKAERFSMGRSGGGRGSRRQGGLISLATAIGSAVSSTRSSGPDPVNANRGFENGSRGMSPAELQRERGMARRASFDDESSDEEKEEDAPPAYAQHAGFARRRSVEGLPPQKGYAGPAVRGAN